MMIRAMAVSRSIKGGQRCSTRCATTTLELDDGEKATPLADQLAGALVRGPYFLRSLIRRIQLGELPGKPFVLLGFLQ